MILDDREPCRVSGAQLHQVCLQRITSKSGRMFPDVWFCSTWVACRLAPKYGCNSITCSNTDAYHSAFTFHVLVCGIDISSSDICCIGFLMQVRGDVKLVTFQIPSGCAVSFIFWFV